MNNRNSSLEGGRHPYLKKSFWLKEYAERINSGKYPKHTVEHYTRLFNQIMTETKNIATIDPTLI